MTELVKRSAAWMARAVRARDDAEVIRRMRAAGAILVGKTNLRSSAGLPAGEGLIARRGEERTLIALAAQLEEAFGGWLDPDAT
ncbi:MAG: hypothetical protein ACXWEE_02305 [Thermoleophilaceae bacterium]